MPVKAVHETPCKQDAHERYATRAMITILRRGAAYPNELRFDDRIHHSVASKHVNAYFIRRFPTRAVRIRRYV